MKLKNKKVLIKFIFENLKKFTHLEDLIKASFTNSNARFTVLYTGFNTYNFLVSLHSLRYSFFAIRTNQWILIVPARDCGDCDESLYMLYLLVKIFVDNSAVLVPKIPEKWNFRYDIIHNQEKAKKDVVYTSTGAFTVDKKYLQDFKSYLDKLNLSYKIGNY